MRVIAGSAKGREITAPRGMHTRPTLAKVKEAVFGMMQFDIPGAEVLDLFSGSGALGIEALSRGAAEAVFCDADRQAFSVMTGNIKKLGFEGRSRAYCCDGLSLLDTLAASGMRFDIVLLDPPYETELQTKAVEKLCALGLLNEGAIVVCEHSPKNPPAVGDARLSPRKPKKYGDCCVSVFVFGSEEHL